MASYGSSELDRISFKGRDNDIQRFIDIMSSGVFSAIYSSSGSGKTSFLSAGIEPKMRDEGFIPIHFVFHNTDNIELDLITAIDNTLAKEGLSWKPLFNEWDLLGRKDVSRLKNNDEQAVLEIDVRESVEIENITKHKQYCENSLWWRFRTFIIIDKNGSPHKPLLVFDQFEEVFRNENNNQEQQSLLRNELFSLLQSLYSNSIPDKIKEALSLIYKHDFLLSLLPQDNYKVIFALRKEFLPDFDYWTNERYSIPDLYRNRMFLQPLSREQAKDVITKQPLINDEQNIIVGQYVDVLDPVADCILDYIDSTGQNKIEPFILSVLCRKLFDLAKEHNKSSFNPEDFQFNTIKSIIRDFYESLLWKLRKTGVFSSEEHIVCIEDLLVSNSDGSRKRVSEIDILLNKEIQKTTKGDRTFIKRLEDEHIIRCSVYGDNTYVEIIHDRISEVIFERQRERSNNNIRLYISTTFNDLREERKSIMARFLPVIQAEAETRMVSVTAIDLQWGLTEDDLASSRFLDISINEVQKCDLFIGIYADRYGWSPSDELLNDETKRKYPWISELVQKGASIQEIEYNALLHSKKQVRSIFMFKRNNERPDNIKLAELKRCIMSQFLVHYYVRIEELEMALRSYFRDYLDTYFPRRLFQNDSIFQEDIFSQYVNCFLDNGGIDALDSFAESSKNYLFVCGEHGSGKTALVTNWIYQRRKTKQIIYIFTDSTEGIDYSLKLIIKKITEILKIAFTPQIKENNELVDDLVLFMDRLEDSLTIVIDGLNLSIFEVEKLFPCHNKVKYIITVVDGYVHSGMSMNSDYYVVQPLSIEQRTNYIVDYLRMYAKALETKYIEMLACDVKSRNIYILKQELDVLIRCCTFDAIDETVRHYLKTISIAEAHQFFLEQYERILGDDLIQSVGVIAVSCKGVNVDYFEELLSPVRWKSLYYVLSNHLIVINNLVKFRNNDVFDAVKKRYIRTKKSENDYRKTLINYCKNNKETNKDELIFQYEELLSQYSEYTIMQNIACFDMINIKNRRFESHLIENRQVRIFLSSTFSDMQKERDALIHTFELLKIEAAKRNVSLSVVDLRWGVTKKEAKSGKVISVCLNEVENSYPFFIGLLGNNYGSAPDRTELKKNPELIERYPWLDDVISDNKDESMSITEMEIQYGVLRNNDDIDAAFFFKKTNQPDNNKRLTTLKEDVRKKYDPYYQNDFATPSELCEKVTAEIRKIIDKHFPEKDVVTPLDREQTAQRAYINSRHSYYFERQSYFDIIDSFVQSDEQNLVFTGESGIGKSALLANWIKKNDNNPNFNLIYHFVGNSFSGNNYENILRHLCDEIYDLYTIKKDEKEGGNTEDEAQRLFSEVFFQEKPLVIVLDGINQLFSRKDEKLLLWLPSANKNVKFIYSTLSDDETLQTFKRREYRIEVVQPLSKDDRRKWAPEYLMRVGKKLDEEKRQLDRIVEDKECENTLVLRTLLDELTCFGVYEKVDERIDYYLSASSVPDFFDRVLQRMENDYSKDQDLVRHALILIAVSERGLSEDELMDLLGCSQRPLGWKLFFCAFYNHIVVRNGLISFSHKYITEAVVSRYHINEKETTGRYRREIIRYFSQHQIEVRSKSELAFQYYNTANWNDLYGVLVDYDTFKYYDNVNPYLLGCYWKALVSVDRDRYSLSAYLSLPSEKNADLSLTLNSIGLFVQDVIADYSIALDFYWQALELGKEVFGTEDPEIATFYNNIGNIYDRQGNYERALEFYLMDLKLTVKHFGMEHPYTATSFNNIGEVYRIIANFEKAEEYHRKAMDIREKCFGVEHSETAQSYNNLGLVYYDMGDYRKALAFHMMYLKINKNVLGENHPDTATAYFNVGMDYVALGEEPQAEEYYLKDLVINEKVLGKMHPNTADSYNNIGELYRKRGDYKKALSYHKQALEIREKIFGKHNHFTAQSYNNIGLVYTGMENYPNALYYLAEAMNIWQAVLGKYNQHVAYCYNNIGMLFDKQEDHDRALHNFKEAVKIQEKILPTGHSDIALSYTNIGSTLYELGRNEEALQYLEKAFTIFRTQLGDNHAYTIVTRNWIKKITEA